MRSSGSSSSSRRSSGCPGPINHPVKLSIAKNDLHVLACFREWNGFDQLGYFVVGAFSFPRSDAVFTGVVGGKRVSRPASKLDEAFEIERAELNVVVGIVKTVFCVT